LRFRSRSASETRAAARRLGAAILAVNETEAIVIGLVGPLGAGKTEWVKGLAEGLGADARLVASPTYVVASEYPLREAGGRPLAHVDLYRVESETELEDAGFLDLLTPGAVVAVEWADRFPKALPADRLEVVLTPVPEAADGREIELRPRGPRAWKLVGEWARRVDRGGSDAWR
jgi:tRNA threonylcarbamoyladenosine biosynthesis protein TsaE